MAVTDAFASPVSPNEPGVGGNTNITNAGSTPGAPPSWVGTVDGVNTGTGNKLVAVPIAGWTARGGLPVSKKDVNTHVTKYTFDTDGDLASVTTPLGNKTQWTYDALGFPTQRTDAMNRATKYTPDAWERLVTTTYPDTSTHTFGYDYNGNLTTFVDGVSVTRSYDKDNRLTTESYNGTVQLTNTYDASGQLGLRATSKHGTQTVTYAYTDRNQLYAVTDNAGTTDYVYSPIISGGSGYDNDGNLTNEILANGAKVSLTYDADSSLSGLTNVLPSGQGASAFSYGYDLDGRMSSGTDYTGSTPSSLSWTYDGQSHLASESRSGGYGPFHDGFTLDGVGNRSQITNIYGTFSYGYDADDELKTYAGGGYTFGYNANGDMTSGTLSGHVSNLTYDYDDQLTGISSQNGSVLYEYDAIGRRVYRQDASGVGHSFIYDGSNLVGEYNDNTSVWDTEYTYGNGLIDKQGVNGTEYEFYDGLGDVYQSLNASGGYVLSGEVADDFGQHFGPAGTMGTDDLFYKWRGDYGYRWDGDGLWTGSYTEPIVEVGARYYIPSMGVFITRDKYLSQKPYEYCGGDPINYVDPTGYDQEGKYWFGVDLVVGAEVLGTAGVVIGTIVGAATAPAWVPVVLVGLAVAAGGMAIWGTIDWAQAGDPALSNSGYPSGSRKTGPTLSYTFTQVNIDPVLFFKWGPPGTIIGNKPGDQNPSPAPPSSGPPSKAEY